MHWFKRRFARSLISGARDLKPSAVAEHRQRLLSSMSGTVLEIGPGAGVNFRFYPKHIRWIGVEPNPFLLDALTKSAQEAGLVDYKVYEGGAEQLPVPDGSVDAVVSTQVFCSVNNPQQVLAEIKRVLKPGGEFVFIEHVGAKRGTAFRQFQNIINPLEKLFGDGCNVNRDTLEMIQGAGFSNIVSDEFKQKEMGMMWPHVAGTAKK